MGEKDRLKYLFSTKLGLGVTDFAKKIHVAQSTLSNLDKKQDQDFSTKILIGIRKAYPDINLEWLLFGEGEPFLSAPTKNSAQNLSINGDFNNASQVMTLQDCSEQLTDKNQKIEQLRDEVKKLQAQVDILKDVLNSK